MYFIYSHLQEKHISDTLLSIRNNTAFPATYVPRFSANNEKT